MAVISTGREIDYPALVTTDLHLTSSPRDEYRWGIFPLLREEAKRVKARSIFILGDLTDAKDRHPAELVNRVVSAVTGLSGHGLDVYLLKGNHDYKNNERAFFEFLSELSGVHYITEPTQFGEDLFLPHTRDTKGWVEISKLQGQFRNVFLHQTLTGSIASNGQKMEGELSKLPFRFSGKALSGDIHVPQDVANITYVGSPYHVHFGDDFSPRLVYLLANGRTTWIDSLSFPKRVSVSVSRPSDLKDLGLRRGDQAKILLVVPQSRAIHWQASREELVEAAERMGVSIEGLELKVLDRRKLQVSESKELSQQVGIESTIEIFAEKERLGDYLVRIGKELARASAAS